MQLFDDLEDFGAFDDAVSGDVRDPYAELAERRREGAIQKLDLSGMPQMEDSKPIFMVYGFDEVEAVLKDNETFSSSMILAVFGDVLGKKVMLGDEARLPAPGRTLEHDPEALPERRLEDVLLVCHGHVVRP